MAKIHPGNIPVLLIVDVQVGVMKVCWDSERIISNINLAVEKARSQAIPIIWVQHSDDELRYQTSEWELVPQLSPLKTDSRIDKHFNSSFEETSLDELLSRFEVSHIVMAGAATNWCIRATAYAALDRGYDLTLIQDAHSTEDMEFEDGVVVKAENIIRDLNAAMKWLNYPGRANRSVTAKDLVF